jgi:glycosyltransferase involved in cell wall biosynthesis
MIVSVCFTNFGPYHLARLRALARRLAESGDRLLAYEMADQERLYPWERQAGSEPFTWTTLFPGRALETITRVECAQAMTKALERDRPDAMGIVGYSRPESAAALRWARATDRPTILMSESQEIDHPRTWWKESLKSRRVRKFSAALVGGPRHRAYLAKLGIPPDRVALGYNAVDHAAFQHWAAEARNDPSARNGLPDRPYFVAANRFVPEKNLPRLIDAFARYRRDAAADRAWDLVLCGSGPDRSAVEAAIEASGSADAIHRPGFVQARELARWLAFASAFVHPSLMEPWGLVVNEAATCGLPLLVSDRAGCVETLVPDPPGTTGRRFDPFDVDEITTALAWVSGLPAAERAAIGQRARETVEPWGPDRFAQGTLEALELAFQHESGQLGRTEPILLTRGNG